MSSSPTAPTASAAQVKTARKRRRLILAWLFVLLWAGVIWQLGTDNFSLAETRESFWWPIVEWMIGDIDAVTRWKAHVWIRKSAHFIEYGILALLTFRAALLSVNKNRLATAGWTALFIVLALASADEARQAFSPVRTGSPYDVLIDLSGGVIVVLGLIFISRRMRSEGNTAAAESSVLS
ncbi:MAG: VanZ family protein [Myxococcota bacterium]